MECLLYFADLHTVSVRKIGEEASLPVSLLTDNPAFVLVIICGKVNSKLHELKSFIHSTHRESAVRGHMDT